jgi:tetraacyldisaccharide 4'-kinase
VSINLSYIEDLMYGRRTSLFFGAVLGFFSVLYGLAIGIRSVCYASGLIGRKRLAQRVVSIGNITLGGTGKTPAVMHVAGVLLRHRKKPVVISRGYGREDESRLVVVSDGTRVLVDARTGGDEPVLMGSKLSGVPIVVDSNRYRAALFAHRTFDSDIVVLDDGFQHVRLQRDLDVVLVDAVDPFGNGKLFPAGILREPLSALQRAHAVLLTGADRVHDIKPLQRLIRQYTTARIFTSRQVPSDVINISTGETKPLAAIKGVGLLALSGIARPGSFVSMLRSLGAEVKVELAYPDHYVYTERDLAEIYRRASDEEIGMIITTEKDAVRLRDKKSEGIWALRIELKVVENKDWEAVLLN